MKQKLIGLLSVIIGAIGVYYTSFITYQSFAPKAVLTNPVSEPVTLTLHNVSLDNDLRAFFSSTDTKHSKTTVLIYLERPMLASPPKLSKTNKSLVRTSLYDERKRKTEAIQQSVVSSLQSLITSKQIEIKKRFIVDNVIVADISGIAIDSLLKTKGVVAVLLDKKIELPPTKKVSILASPEWNIATIRADKVWQELQLDGAGVVVANIDSGVQWDHPSLKTKYRGWNGSTANHNYNWYDPSNLSPTEPLDNNGHGTHTMGTIAGSDDTHAIGVAPGARWIAAKGCESNFCSLSNLLAAGQWILAPTQLDGTNPDPSKAPDVVSNSWGSPGCYPFFQGVVDSWNAAGIYSVFSAGNSGPNSSTIGSPGDYETSYSVGAVDNTDTIARFSSRGPSCMMFGGRIKPEISAPGVSILSSLPYDDYIALSGTSMATPHIAGVAALLLQSKPNLTPYEIGYIMRKSSMDLGTPGMDNSYGSGRVDAYNAVTFDSSNIPTPTPTPIRTPTPTPRPPRSVKVIFPNGGEVLEHYEQYIITWNETDDILYSDIQLTSDTDEVIHNIATVNYPKTTYKWYAHSGYPDAQKLKIKILGYSSPWSTPATDSSDTSFTIHTTQPTNTPSPMPTSTPTVTPSPSPSPTNTPPSTPTQIPTPSPTPLPNNNPIIITTKLPNGVYSRQYNAIISATDGNRDQLTMTFTGLPNGVTQGPCTFVKTNSDGVSQINCTIQGVPRAWGLFNITATAFDSRGGSNKKIFNLTILPWWYN